MLTAQQNLLEQQDQLAVTRGSVAQALISLYRALGGGWQAREGEGFVRADIRDAMAERTDWGGLLREERFGEAAATRPIPAPAF